MHDVERWTNRFTDRAEEKMIEALAYVGEHFVKIARDRLPEESFYDHTGNLRSSLGYVIVQDGDIILGDFERSDRGTEGATGVQEAKKLTQKLALTYNKGLVLIGVAGMHYAVRVEQLEGKDVISGPQIAAEEMLKRIIRKTLNG